MNEINKYNAQEEMLKVINHRIDKKQIYDDMIGEKSGHVTASELNISMMWSL